MDVSTRIKGDLRPRHKHYEPDVKLRILDMFERGNVPVDEITGSFGITKKTIYNWCSAYERDGMAGLEDAPQERASPGWRASCS